MESSWNETVGSVVITASFLWLLSFLIRRLVLEWIYDSHQGKVVAITGCDSGFGRDTALRLVSKGCVVIAGCFLENSLSDLKESAGEHADRMITFSLDLADDASTDRFVNSIREYLKDNNKRLHGLVNNAGLFTAGPSEWMSRDIMRKVLNVNAVGAMELSNRMAPLLHRSNGRLVSISSVSAVVHGPQLALYGASKAAFDNFMSAMRVETDRSFSVHLVMPGGFRTPLLNPQALRATMSSNWERAPEAVKHDYGTEYFSTLMNNWADGAVKFANRNPSWVVSQVEHALFSTYPRARYYTGIDALLLFAPLSFAPTWIQDRIMRRINARFTRSPTTGRKVNMALYEDDFTPLTDTPRAA